MNETGPRRQKWELTGEALEKFLAALDPDSHRAGEKYETIREALISFFDWQGGLSPEDLCDETLNRVVRKIDEGEVVRNIPAYCRAVARLVLLEDRIVTTARRADVEELAALPAPAPVENCDERSEWLKNCLRELPLESRQLVLQYYKEDKQQNIDARAALAARLGVPLNALRSRIQRLRDRLEHCVRRAMQRKLLAKK
jgi:DNA-directed RNA polymerase specialized sigma24 family protein